MSSGVWACAHKRDIMKLIPLEMMPLIAQRCTSTSEPSEIMPVSEQGHIFFKTTAFVLK